ncbi:heat shock protein HtpX [Novipirellula aureliae]|uniref:Heat shock protein HtpX n=2 Tax=Novipirellula aureliae TaxID=2527966 RepID=A0A5C6DLI9_9BACT|nr:heat shock protein HtpX [Novipirellula aureliae]
MIEIPKPSPPAPRQTAKENIGPMPTTRLPQPTSKPTFGDGVGDAIAKNAATDKKAVAKNLASQLANLSNAPELPAEPVADVSPVVDDSDDFFKALDAATESVNEAVLAQQRMRTAALAAKLTPAQIETCFRGDFEPVVQNWSYGHSLLGTAAMMLFLPSLFTIIVLVSTVFMFIGIYTWSGRESTGQLPNPFLAFGAIGLGLLVLACWVPIVSMFFATIATLFSGTHKAPETRTLTREAQPTMYEFVDQICKRMGTPPPSRIDLNCGFNASASFDHGMLSFEKNNLVLTLGVPLIATQSAEQLASVIAHEFGHFCQGAGMRVHFVLANLNGWFVHSASRKAYRDEMVADVVSNSDIGSSVFGLLWAINYVIGSIGRYMMRIFAYVGYASSGSLSRQMEFDADRYAVHLAGSKAFCESETSAQQFGVAYRVSVMNLQMLYQAGILVDNIPRLVQHIGKTMPATTIERIAKASEQERINAFDTHPPSRDRKRAAMELAKPGIVKVGRPARDLIDRWTDLCENITLDFYREVTGMKISKQNVSKLEDVLAAEHKLLLDKE